MYTSSVAGWSSQVARQAHNLKVRGSNPLPATNLLIILYFLVKILVDSILFYIFFIITLLMGLLLH